MGSGFVLLFLFWCVCVVVSNTPIILSLMSLKRKRVCTKVFNYFCVE